MVTRVQRPFPLVATKGQQSANFLVSLGFTIDKTGIFNAHFACESTNEIVRVRKNALNCMPFTEECSGKILHYLWAKKINRSLPTIYYKINSCFGVFMTHRKICFIFK